MFIFSNVSDDKFFMSEAMKEAALAAEHGDVPVGAVVVSDGKIIARAHNEREKNGIATAHAEILAIEEACRVKGSWRLSDCTLYVTLEPCPMCAGAIINSRVEKVVFGAKDSRAGALGSLIDLKNYPLNHKPQCVSGIMERECADILRAFFAKKR